jgi:arginase
MPSEKTSRPVAVIGAGLDLGAGRRGVDMGPSAIRYAGLQERVVGLGRACVDWGDVEVTVAEATEVGDPRARFLESIKRSCSLVADLVRQADLDGFVPLVLGGDHSVAIGSLGGMATSRGAGAVLWVDAHGDLNRPSTSPTGNVHGMPLAAALGAAGPEFATPAWPTPSIRRAALVGVRSLDDGERVLIAERADEVRVLTMSDVDRLGVERVLADALEFLAGAEFLHLSFDLDAVDPTYAPGVGTPVRGGLSYREAHLALELVAESGLLDSLELVEVNPILDRENATGELAVELAASALGARIL